MSRAGEARAEGTAFEALLRPGGLAAALFQDTAFGTLAMDRDGRIVCCNDALIRLLDGVCDLSPGQPAALVFEESRREIAWTRLFPVLEGRAPSSRFVSALAAKGERGPVVEASATPVRDAEGAVQGVIMRLADISVQKQLEAQLAHGQRAQSIGQFAAGIAHDFNNLLTAVLGAAEAALGRPALDAETRDDLSQIQESAQRGAGIVRQLLAYARQSRLRPEDVGVDEALSGMDGLLRRLLGRRIRLQLDLAAAESVVRVDPTQLDQVLVNLASNARDAMPRGGTLTLRSRLASPEAVPSEGPCALPRGRYVVIEVEDTGGGIPPEVLPRIFDPFFTTRRDQGGTGLGLSMVQGIVRQSGGSLTVESTPGIGTVFRVFLPCCVVSVAVATLLRAAALLPVPPPVSGIAGGGDRVVLLVDDEEPIRRLAGRAFARAGWRVVAAGSGDEALALLDEATAASLSLAVSDLSMPGMDGRELLRAVRERHPGLPAILASGYMDASLREAAEVEALTLVEKPYTPRQLLARAEALLGMVPA